MTETIQEAIAAHKAQVEADLADFYRRYAVKFIVAISGGAEADNPELATTAITGLARALEGSGAAILSGGTQGGVPELATKIARAHGLPTMGVYPSKGAKYALYDQLDYALQTPDPSIGVGGFGAETYAFAQLSQHLVVIAGGFGTLIELATVLKINTKRKKYEPPPIYVYPLSGSGGAAELIPSIIQLVPEMAYCLPNMELRSGTDIAELILARQHAVVDSADK